MIMCWPALVEKFRKMVQWIRW